jgi:hypothetical protein
VGFTVGHAEDKRLKRPTLEPLTNGLYVHL